MLNPLTSYWVPAGHPLCSLFGSFLTSLLRPPNDHFGIPFQRHFCRVLSLGAREVVMVGPHQQNGRKSRGLPVYRPENEHGNGKPTILHMYFLNMGIFQCHVSFQGG